MPKVTQIFAYVIADKDEDDEGIPAFIGDDGTAMPMIGANMKRAEDLRPFAQEISDISGKEIRLLIFDGPPTLLVTITPKKKYN